MSFEQLVRVFAQRLGHLPEAVLHPDFDISNISELDDVVQELLDEDQADGETIRFAIHSARVLLRRELGDHD